MTYDKAMSLFLENGFGSDSPYCPWCGAHWDSELHMQECVRDLDAPLPECDTCGRTTGGGWCWACDDVDET